MSQQAGVVYQVPGDLWLPGGEDTIALAPLGRDAFDRLLHEHPGRDVAGDMVDVQAMAPALLAACAVAPALTEGEALAVLDEWPAGEVDALLEQLFALTPADPVERAWWRLERDPTLRLEMAYCAPNGVPHSRFLGGPNHWTGHDRELAMAWQLRKAATCPTCGTRRDEWDRDPDAYYADLTRCRGDELLREAEQGIPPGKDGQGIYAVLRPRSTDAADAADDGEPAG